MSLFFALVILRFSRVSALKLFKGVESVKHMFTFPAIQKLITSSFLSPVANTLPIGLKSINSIACHIFKYPLLLVFGFYFMGAGRTIAPHSLNKKPLKFTALVFGFAFQCLNHARNSSMLSATARRAMDAAHSKSSHSWRSLNSLLFIYPRFISDLALVALGVVTAFGAFFAPSGAATLNGYIARCKRIYLSSPVTRRARFMPRKSGAVFAPERGINSGALLVNAFVVTAIKILRALAHIMFSLLQGFGGGKAPIVSYV